MSLVSNVEPAALSSALLRDLDHSQVIILLLSYNRAVRSRWSAPPNDEPQ